MSSETNSGESGHSDGMDGVKVFIPTDLHSEIESQLEYGDSKSAWIREACRMRATVEHDLLRAGDDETADE